MKKFEEKMMQWDKCMSAWEAKLAQKQMSFPVEIVSGVLFILFAVVILLLMPSQVEVGTKEIINGRAFPELLMTLCIIASAAVIGRELFNVFVRKHPWTMKTLSLATEVRALAIFAILVLTYAISSLTGLFVIGAIFCSLAFLVFFRCPKPSYYLITVTMAVAIWAVFRFILNVRF